MKDNGAGVVFRCKMHYQHLMGGVLGQSSSSVCIMVSFSAEPPPSSQPWVTAPHHPHRDQRLGGKAPEVSVHALVSNFINSVTFRELGQLGKFTQTTQVWGGVVTWAGPTNLLTIQL